MSVAPIIQTWISFSMGTKLFVVSIGVTTNMLFYSIPISCLTLSCFIQPVHLPHARFDI